MEEAKSMYYRRRKRPNIRITTLGDLHRSFVDGCSTRRLAQLSQLPEDEVVKRLLAMGVTQETIDYQNRFHAGL